MLGRPQGLCLELSTSMMHVEPVKAASHSHHKGEILHIKVIPNGMKLIHPDFNEV